MYAPRLDDASEFCRAPLLPSFLSLVLALVTPKVDYSLPILSRPARITLPMPSSSCTPLPLYPLISSTARTSEHASPPPRALSSSTNLAHRNHTSDHSTRSTSTLRHDLSHSIRHLAALLPRQLGLCAVGAKGALETRLRSIIQWSLPFKKTAPSEPQAGTASADFEPRRRRGALQVSAPISLHPKEVQTAQGAPF